MSEHVFKETPQGLKFVGDFEGLYASVADPWDQSNVAGPMGWFYGEQRAGVLDVVSQYGVRCALEVGCGHGHLTAMLDRLLPDGAIGYDIAPRAIERAHELHPSVNFFVRDICAPIDHRPSVDCVIWSNCLWYLLHKLDAAVANSLSLLARDQLFIVSQGFLHDGDQNYGREIANGFAGSVKTFVERYGEQMQLVEALFDAKGSYPLRDGIIVFRKL